MALISPSDQERLREEFEKMPGRVTLAFFTQTLECDSCPQVMQILNEVTALTDKVVVQEMNPLLQPDRAERLGIDKVPGIAILSTDQQGSSHDLGLRFLGVPSGYEFVSLIHGILLAGGKPPELSAETLARLADLRGPATIRVFTTPTCVYCPRAVDLAFDLAAACPHITAYAIEATGFPDLIRQYQISGVPKTVVDDRVEILGAVPEEEFMQQAFGDGAQSGMRS